MNIRNVANLSSSEESDQLEEIPLNNKKHQRKQSWLNSNSLTSNANDFFYKLQLKKLPEVSVSAYAETKQLFSDSENIVRLQAAIKDKTVLRIGGKGLFNPRTYNICVENVNKRLKNNFNFLTKEANELEQQIKIRPENKELLVQFMDKLRNFCVLAEAYKDLSYLTNKRFLANISDKVPSFLKSKWERKQSRLEYASIVPHLRHMINIFDRELPGIEAGIRNDKLRSNNFNKVEKVGLNSNKNRMYSTNVTNKRLNFTQNSSVDSDSSEKETFLCWFHKSNNHVSNKCKDLWKLDGKKVAQIARKNKICTYCGKPFHQPCPNNTKLKCNITGCNLNHHSMFCYSRKAKKAENPKVSYGENSDKPQKKEKSNFSNNKIKKSSNEISENSCESSDNVFNNYYTNIPDELQKYLAKFQEDKQFGHIVMVMNENQNVLNQNESKIDRCIQGVLVVKLDNNKNYAFLIDSGSSVSLIEEKVANGLRIKGPWLPLTLSWSGNYKRTDNTSN